MERNADRAGDAAHAVEHLGEGGRAGIGDAERGGDDAIAGHVERIEAGLAAMRAEMPSKTPGSVRHHRVADSARSVVASAKPSSRRCSSGGSRGRSAPLFFSRIVPLDLLLSDLELWREAATKRKASISESGPRKSQFFPPSRCIHAIRDRYSEPPAIDHAFRGNYLRVSRKIQHDWDRV